MTDPILTVLMSVHNGEPYLKDAVSSILNQTYRNFKFLVLDNASTDKSQEIILEFKDSRIELVKLPENIGLAAALNRGIQMIDTPLIARMDADDVSLPKRFEKQVKFLNSNLEVAVVGSYFTNIDSDGNLLGYKKLPVNPNSNLLYIITGHNPLIHPGVMYRKKVIKAIGGYREEYMPSEDIDLWLRLYQNGYVCENIPERLTCIRKHSDQGSVNQHNKQNNKHLLAFYNFYNELNKNSINYDKIKQYFNVLVWRIEKVTLNNFFKILTILLDLYRILVPPNKKGYSIFSKFREIQLLQIFGLIYLISRTNIYSIIIAKLWNR